MFHLNPGPGVELSFHSSDQEELLLGNWPQGSPPQAPHLILPFPSWSPLQPLGAPAHNDLPRPPLRCGAKGHLRLLCILAALTAGPMCLPGGGLLTTEGPGCFLPSWYPSPGSCQCSHGLDTGGGDRFQLGPCPQSQGKATSLDQIGPQEVVDCAR